MNVRILDIETVANSRSAEFFERKQYSAPANYKDPAKIEAAIEEKRNADKEKAGLYWWSGKICMIGMDGITFKGEDEEKLLTDFFTYVQESYKKQGYVHFVGKSYLYFDKPFIIGRAIALDLGLPEGFRPNHHIEDVDHIFSRSAACAQVTSLDNYAWGMGMEGKLANGSHVQAWYDERKWDDLEKYCLQDVMITRALYERAFKPFEARD